MTHSLGKPITVFFQRTVDTIQGKADKVGRLNHPFKRQMQKTAREPLTEVSRSHNNFAWSIPKCDPHINLD